MPRKKISSEETVNTFTLSFMGEYVNVITDIMIVEYHQTELQSSEQNAPMVTRGYFLDEDNNFIYLGDNPLEISQAVSKNRIVVINVEQKKSKYDEILDEMSEPSKNEDFN